MKTSTLFFLLLFPNSSFSHPCDELFNANLIGIDFINKIEAYPSLIKIAQESVFEIKIKAYNKRAALRTFKKLTKEFALVDPFSERMGRENDKTRVAYSKYHMSVYLEHIYHGSGKYLASEILVHIIRHPDIIKILKAITQKEILGSNSLILDEDSMYTFTNRKSEDLEEFKTPTQTKEKFRKLWGQDVPIQFIIPPEVISPLEYKLATEAVLYEVSKKFSATYEGPYARSSPERIVIQIVRKGSVFSPSDERLLYMSDITFKVSVYDIHIQKPFVSNIRVLRRPYSKDYRVDTSTLHHPGL